MFGVDEKNGLVSKREKCLLIKFIGENVSGIQKARANEPFGALSNMLSNGVFYNGKFSMASNLLSAMREWWNERCVVSPVVYIVGLIFCCQLTFTPTNAATQQRGHMRGRNSDSEKKSRSILTVERGSDSVREGSSYISVGFLASPRLAWQVVWHDFGGNSTELASYLGIYVKAFFECVEGQNALACMKTWRLLSRREEVRTRGSE